MTRGKMRAAMAALTLAGGLVTTGQAQSAFFNGSFELPVQPAIDANAPGGWHMPDPGLTFIRNNGEVVGVNAQQGTRFIELAADGTGLFRGVTTDYLNRIHDPLTGLLCRDPDGDGIANGLCPLPPQGRPYYDAPFDWNGGDIEITAWINIPGQLAAPTLETLPDGSQALIGEVVGVFFYPKGAGNGLQNNGEFSFVVDARQARTTNGQWVQLGGIVPIQTIRDQVIQLGANGAWTMPPFPNRMKITIGRWKFDYPGTAASAFIDNVVYRQLPVGPTRCNLADITGIGGPPSAPDGLLTGDDFNAFIGAFAAGDLLADITGIGGPPADPDGLVTGDDFNAFIAAFAAGCP